MHRQAGTELEAVVVKNGIRVGNAENPPVDMSRQQGGNREILVAEFDRLGQLVGGRTVDVEKVDAHLVAILEAEHHLEPTLVEAALQAEVALAAERGADNPWNGVVLVDLQVG